MNNIDLRSSPIVLLDDSRPPHKSGASLLFHSPEYIIRADTFEDVARALEAIDEAHAKGLHTVGWISYEVAAAFEPRLARHITAKAHEPLIWMMATAHREKLTASAVRELFHSAARGNQRSNTIEITPAAHDQQAYLDAFGKIQTFIQAGDVYQINHTFPSPVEVTGDPLALYQKLRASQPVAYGAYIDTGPGSDDMKVLSLSPELFFEKAGDKLTAKPMKGTAPRGSNNSEDTEISTLLRADEKSRAENLMIVDLIRNDLSRIAMKASVKTEALFQIEKYPTLFQMTSTITAKAKRGLKPSELLTAMFPCGSVTGAPKLRAMEIISELEKTPRGVYCGAIGHFSPATQRRPEAWSLNVPIRTLCLPNSGAGRLSVGSGIVADSNGEAEYQECLLKARFVTAPRPDFAIIETIRLAEGRFHYLEHHLKRMKASAEYFDFDFDLLGIERALKEHADCAPQGNIMRCRLLLTKEGHCSVTGTTLDVAEYIDGCEFSEILALPLAGTVKLSDRPVNERDLFFQHKTTLRTLFDHEYRLAQTEGHLDVLFLNGNSNVTEGAISTVYILKGQRVITPPVSDGLLPGIQRAAMIAALPKANIDVRSISSAELFGADAILIGNAVRGLRRVILQ